MLKPASVCFNVDPIQCADSIARSAIALEATYTDIQACFPDPQLYRFNSDGSFTPVRDRGTSGRDGRVALVLVHGTQEGNLFTLGIGCKKPYESTWREFLSKYQSELQNDFQVYSFAYNSTGSIDVNGSELASRIQYISSEAPTVVLAHSMGGLVARSALVSHLADLQGIVTLATPHTGMRLSTLRELFSDFVDFAIGPSLGKMDLDPESQFLSQLRAGETEAHTRRYDVYAGAADKFVSESSALFEGVLVKNRQTFPGINHSTIRTNSQVFSAVKSALLDFLQAPPPPPPPSASRPKPFPLSYQAPRCDFTAPVGPAVQLNWTVSIDATSYEVYRNGIQMSDKFGNTSFPSTQLSFDIQIGLIAGQSYQFKVIARNAAGPTDSNTITVSIPTNICSGGGTKPELFTLSNEPPRCDFNVRVEPAVQLTWTPSIGATSYEVYRNDIRLQDQFGNTSFPSTQLSFDIQIGLIAGQSYRFKVIARNATGLTDSLPIDFTVQIPSNICPTSKTVTVANTGGIGLNLRIGPGENFSILKALPEGTQMSVVGGPTQADGLSWWNLTSPLGTGWSAVADWLTPLTPSLNSQVTVTFTGVFGLRLRQCPGLNCTILRTLQDGTVMTVIAGPVSADGYTWWGLTGPMGTGWSAVGNWLAPNPRS